MGVSVSVIVPTLNRGTLLLDVLRDLLAQDPPDFEILVVDQTTPPHVEVPPFCARRPGRVRYLHTPIKGLAHGRNYGIARCRTDVVLFCDDDVVLRPGFVAAHAARYEDPRVGGVGGRILVGGIDPGDDPSPVGWMSPVLALGREGFHARHREDVLHVQGCNMSYRRDLLVRLGGFDERFAGTAHLEDADLAFSIREAGYRLVFEPGAELLHMKAPGGGCRPGNLRRLVFWYCHNFTLFHRKHYPIEYFPAFVLSRVLRSALFALEFGDPALLPEGLRGILQGCASLRNLSPDLTTRTGRAPRR